jgi:16S rRNA (uracil1498-N3)-methyltransferase
MSPQRDVTAPVFLVEPGALTNDFVVIDGSEGKHAATVRRLQVGEPIVVTDGHGAWVAGAVQAVEGRDRIVVAVHESGVDAPPHVRLTVLQAMPKGDRGETAVETLTEVGVDVIVPWISERTQIRLDSDREAKILGRWRTTAREAGKQARRTFAPVVADVVRRQEALALVQAATLAIVLDAEAGLALGDLDPPSQGDIVLVVGPEGGLTPGELADFVIAAATPARLGPSVLRTSTAGTVAAGVVLSRTSRWSINPLDGDRTQA